MTRVESDVRTAIEAEQLYRFFHSGDEEVLALRGVSLRVSAGEVVAVMGPSGSGKSTLLACLAGTDEPDGGVVHIAGQRMSRRSEPERAARRGRSVGLLFQQGNLLAELTVVENVRIAQQLVAGRPGTSSAIEPAELLDWLGLAGRAGARPGTLSGGEKARAGLAVAVANNPAVLLADEPTGELDESTASGVVDLLCRQAARGAAVVVATHSPQVAAAADRTIHMVDGRVVP